MRGIGIMIVLSALMLLLGCSAREPEDPATGANPSTTPSQTQPNPSNTSSRTQAKPSGTISDYGGSLIIASNKGDKAAVELLLSKGVPVTERDGISGSTPLFEAVYGNHFEIVKVLVEHGADVNSKNDGKSMLEWSKLKDPVNTDIVKYLESKGAK